MFAESYRHFLSKRLLSGKTLNDACVVGLAPPARVKSCVTDGRLCALFVPRYEKSMITKLKLECGAQVTSKMEGMMNNLQLGRERRAEYAVERSTGGGAPLVCNDVSHAVCRYAKEWNKDGHRWDFTVTVLQTGFWPNFFNPPTVRLAPELRVATEHYAKFYGKKFDHRKVSSQRRVDKQQNQFSTTRHCV